jgi:endonuclease-3 related protein
VTAISLNKPSRYTLQALYGMLYELYGPQGWWPGRSRLEVIVGAILTQNTAWSNVEKAIKQLKARRLLISPAKLHGTANSELARLIRPAGYYNVKARRLKNFTTFLMRKYGGSLNRMAKTSTSLLRCELLKINGIGPETRDSILLYVFNRPVFVIDTYTKRIFSRHGLFPYSMDYEHVQAVFTECLPSDEKAFNEYHALIVRIGKEFCKKSPKCGKCPLKGAKIVAKKTG